MEYINQTKPKVKEGELRIQELKHYLTSLNLPMAVWLSEDATGCTDKVEFDCKSNQMIGLVLPLNVKTGMPIPFTYMARSVEEIQQNMKREKSGYVYIVMAQPLMQGVPPFVLQLFGSNSKFTAKDVLLRWRYTLDELAK